MARCVRPRSTATRMRSAGLLSESNDASLWQCRSAKTRSTGASAWAVIIGPAALDPLHERLLEEVEVLQGAPRPERHAVERILGHVAGHARDLGQQLVEVAQQRAAARHDHALVDDVAGELRRRLLEDHADRGDDLLKG